MASDISLTSSRKRVPLSACLKLPSRRRRAPVNDPFSWPKSSDSSRPSDMAAQFILMKDLSLRGELKWMAPAIISLPVPDSPVMSTVASEFAARAVVSRSLTMAGLLPMMLPESKRSPTSSRRRRFSSRSML